MFAADVNVLCEVLFEYLLPFDSIIFIKLSFIQLYQCFFLHEFAVVS